MCDDVLFFFFNDTATTEIYTLSLHDALPICWRGRGPCRATRHPGRRACRNPAAAPRPRWRARRGRSEEHTSELQSRQYLVCRLLLEKKKTIHLLSFIYLHLSLIPSSVCDTQV